MNNNNPHGQGWVARYGYPNQQQQQQQQQQPNPYGQPQRRPMVVIPRMSQEQLAQYYSQQQQSPQQPQQQQHVYHQSAANFPPPSPVYYQTPQSPQTQQHHGQIHSQMPGQIYQQQMQFTPQQQMLYNQQMYGMGFQTPQSQAQSYQSPQMHQMAPPSFPRQSPVIQSHSPPQPQPSMLPNVPQSPLVPQSPIQQQHMQQLQQQRYQQQVQQQQQQQLRRTSSTPSLPQQTQVHQQFPPSLLARQPQVIISSTARQPSQSAQKPAQKPPMESPSLDNNQTIAPSVLSKPAATIPHPQLKVEPQEPDNDVDYQLVLLSLADQFITTARSLATNLARSGSPKDLSNYHDLMSRGLTCLDSAVNNWKMSDPRGEAKLRLQYANLLFEETDNDETALAVLSKGVTLCERNRLTNQKLAMQHLLARIQFKTNHKAAFKAIDAIVEDLIAFKNTLWIYVFRLLRVALAMQRGSVADIHSTLQQLRSLASLAESRRDVPILVMAHVLEALLYVKSRSPDAVEHAQRSIAAARSYQLNSSLEKIPQLRTLVHFSDISCDLATSSLDQLGNKIKVLQELVDKLGGDNKVWPSSTFQLPTNIEAADNLAEQTGGILRKTDAGKTSITFTWLNKNELFMLGFLLSGAASLQRNCLDERAEQYFSEGINYAKSSEETKVSKRSLDSACASVAREQSLSIALHVFRIFSLSIRSNWQMAESQLTHLMSNHPDFASGRFGQVISYLDGAVKQANGSVQEALACYSSPALTFPDGPAPKITPPDLDLRILATLNRVSILKLWPNRMAEADSLLDTVFPSCQSHQNLSIQSAANLLRTQTTPDLAVIKLKTFLQTSLTAAQRVQNHQLISMVMNLMVARFFGGIVGEQAEKSATVGWQLSRRMRSPVWMAASTVNLAKCMNVHARVDEAQTKMDEASSYWNKASDGVKVALEQLDSTM